MPSDLPPLPEEAFDGEHQSAALTNTRCSHSSVKIQDGVLVCTCGAGWSGPNILELYRLLTRRTI